MDEDQTFLDQVAQAFGYLDLFDYLNNGANAFGGSDYAGADSLFSVNDMMTAQITELLADLNDMIRSGALTPTTQLLGALGLVHSGKQGVDKVQNWSNNLTTAQNAGELAGGLGLVGNTAGNSSDLLGAASAALAVIAAGLAPEAAAAVLIASGTLNLLSNALGAIQNAVGTFNTLMQALDGALNDAHGNAAGDPVVIDPPGDGSHDTGGSSGGSTGGDTGGETGGDTGGETGDAPAEPLVIYPQDDWDTVHVEPDQQESLINSDYAPPPQRDPSTSTDGTGDSSGGTSDSSGGSSRYPELDDLFRPPAGGWGNTGGTGGSGTGGGGSGSSSGSGSSGFGLGTPSGGSKVKRDPLVLDLDGDGIELTQVGQPPVFFDADGDGIAGLTGWVDPDDGLLARDLDGNGVIETQGELFGTNTVDAISDLASQDGNGDGLITADDAIWSSLRVWRDLNQDGVSTANEVQTMDEAGVLNISLDQQRSGVVSGDNLIHSTTTFETTAGAQGSAAAVFFGVNALYSQTTQPVVFEDGSPQLEVPNVKGFGDLADLRVATYNDPELLALVQALVVDAETLTGGEFQARFEAVALRWAGVEEVAPGTDDTAPNQQHEAFLAAFQGVARPDIAGDSRALVLAEDGYYSTLSSLSLRFGIDLATARLDGASTPEQISAAIQGPFFALSFASASVSTGTVTGGLERIIHEVAMGLPDDLGAAMTKLDKVMPFLAAFRDEYFPEENDPLDSTFQNEDFNAFVQTALNRYIDNPTLAKFAFAAVNSNLNVVGTDGVDTGTITMSSLDNLSSRSKIIDLGQGDDVVNVEVVVPAGESLWPQADISFVYRDGDGSDTIDLGDNNVAYRLFLPDINANQVSISTLPSGVDALVEFYNGQTITFTGLGAIGNSVEIWTADGTQLDAGGFGASRIHVSTAADEDFVGAANLTGNYFYSVGGGADTITEPNPTSAGLTDRVVFGDINRSDLIIATDGNDMVLTFANGQPGDSLRLVNQLAVNGYYSNAPAYKVERFEFADGESVTAQDLVDRYIADQSTGGDDTITGLRFPDLIPLSDGTDVANGGNSGDTYLRAATVTGTTTIEDNGAAGVDSVIIEGFSRSQASFSRDGNDLTITLPNGSVILKNQLSTNLADVIEQVVFDDAAMAAVDLTAQVVPSSGAFVDLTGTIDPETLTGTSADERVDGLAGDDLLDGGGGSDLYVFSNGSGNDIIDEHGSGGTVSVDRVQFAGVSAGDVSLTRIGVDLEIKVLATGQFLTIDQQFTSESVGIEFFEFADGTVWDRDEISANSYIVGTTGADTLTGGTDDENFLGLAGDDLLKGGRGADVYVLRAGDGNDTIDDGIFFNDFSIFNTLRLEDANLADLRIEISNDGTSQLDILLRYGANDSVTLVDGFATADFATLRPVQRVELADGTVLSDADLVDRAVLYGTSGDDIIEGFVRVDALEGDDVITGWGTETDFYWRAGSGNDRIINTGRGEGSGRVIAEGLDRAAVSLGRDGLDLVITNIATGETVTIQDQFAAAASNRKMGVNEVVFEDGGLGRNALATASLTPATAADDTIIGGADAEYFRGLAGDDTLEGKLGSDTYSWAKGDGNDTIIDGSRFTTFAADVLKLTDVTSRSNVALSRSGGISDDLQVTVLETGEVITIAGQLAYGNYGVQTIQFADGSVLTLAGISGSIPLVDLANAGVLDGDSDANILEGGEGADLLNGKEGADTYVWARGDGDDTIAETAIDYVFDESDPEGGYAEVVVPVESAGDLLRLAGVRSDEVTLEHPAGTDDLVITILDTGEKITVANQFLAPLAGIERIQFSNASFMRVDIHAAVGGETFAGDGTDQVLAGGFGPDVFTLSVGNETVETGGGHDTIIIGDNGGLDRIEGFDRGVNGTDIQFTHNPFADFAALLAASSDTADGVVIDLGGDNVVTLVGLYVSDLEAEHFGFTRVPILGTDARDDITGSRLNDFIFLQDGDDLVQGNGGDDTIDGGDGRDVVFYAGSSADFSIVRDGALVTVTDINPDDGDEGVDTIQNAELLSFLGDRVTVSLVNRAPVPATAGNAASGTEDTVLTGAVPAATDPDGDVALIYALAGAAIEGLSFDASGTYTYQPPADFNGQVSFDYVVSDPEGNTSAPTAFTLTIASVNDAPVLAQALVDQVFNANESIRFVLPEGAFTDVDGDPLSLAAELANGDALPSWLDFDAATRSFSGTPPAHDTATLDLRVTASDGARAANDVFRLTIEASNQAPEVNDDTGLSTPAGAALRIAISDLLANDHDPDGDTLSISAVSAAQNGTVAIAGDEILFTPDAGFAGHASFRYTASDGTLSGSAQVSIDVVNAYTGFRQGTDGNDNLHGGFFRPNQIYGAGGNDRITGGINRDHLAGGSGKDVLYGGWGNDILDGGTGKDRLFGGWGNDVFVFADGYGQDRIEDFGTGGRWFWGRGNSDVIRIDVEGIDTFEDLLATSSSSGRNTLFDFGDGDTLFIRNVDLNHLSASHFEFV